MKRIEWMLSFGLVLLTLFATGAYAESPREQLNQMIQQLRQNSSDDALREKIIKLAQQIKPSPAAPAEAQELEGAAEYAFKNAKSEADFADAAVQYGKALALAPWMAADYFNQGVALEKSGSTVDAMASFEWYLKAAPNAKDTSDVRKHIGGLKYKQEKLAKDKQKEADAHVQQAAQQQAAQKAAQEQGAAWTKSLNGAKWRRDWHAEPFGEVVEAYDEVVCSGSIFVATRHMIRDDMPGQMPAGSSAALWTATLKSGERAFPSTDNSGYVSGHGVISEDGQTITVQYPDETHVFTRE